MTRELLGCDLYFLRKWWVKKKISFWSWNWSQGQFCGTFSSEITITLELDVSTSNGEKCWERFNLMGFDQKFTFEWFKVLIECL